MATWKPRAHRTSCDRLDRSSGQEDASAPSFGTRFPPSPPPESARNLGYEYCKGLGCATSVWGRKPGRTSEPESAEAAPSIIHLRDLDCAHMFLNRTDDAFVSRWRGFQWNVRSAVEAYRKEVALSLRNAAGQW